MYSLEPNVEYQIRLFCITDEEETEKIIATFTLPRVHYISQFMYYTYATLYIKL